MERLFLVYSFWKPCEMTKPKTAPAQTTSKSASEFEIPVEVMSWLKEDFNHETPGGLTLTETVTPKTSILDLVRRLADKYPAFKKKTFEHKDGLTEYCMVILNGRLISPAELSQEIKPGDKITLTPAFYGG
jgi:molybdopterin converting factor small subunit